MSVDFKTVYSDLVANECVTPQLKHEEKNAVGIVACISVKTEVNKRRHGDCSQRLRLIN